MSEAAGRSLAISCLLGPFGLLLAHRLHTLQLFGARFAGEEGRECRLQALKDESKLDYRKEQNVGKSKQLVASVRFSPLHHWSIHLANRPHRSGAIGEQYDSSPSSHPYSHTPGIPLHLQSQNGAQSINQDKYFSDTEELAKLVEAFLAADVYDPKRSALIDKIKLEGNKWVRRSGGPGRVLSP